MENKKVVINFAKNAWYQKGQQRLKETFIKNGYTGDFLLYQDEKQIESPSHKENPYAFKVYAFKKAMQLGYKTIFWVDSSVYAIRPFDVVWNIVKKDGYFMVYAGHVVGRWANDNSLKYFGITRDEAMIMGMYGNCGLLGLDMDNQISVDFFDRWEESMLAGAFKGEWSNNNKTESQDDRCSGHRHDMTCGSIIANQLGMDKNYQDGDKWLKYGSPTEPLPNETFLFKAHPA